jgi:lysophospholipase L1-like esterase
MNYPGRRFAIRYLSFIALLISVRSAAQQPVNALHAEPAPLTTPVPLHQPPPFWNEITEFKRQDSIQHPPSGGILFIGSSSFRKWTNIQSCFPGYPIINRGFGGSGFPDLIRYAGDIIFPYHPRQIVIYCGDNDLASSDSVTATMVYNRFVRLYTIIRSRLKEVDIVYVSIKPSPSRQKLMPRMEEVNDMVRNFMASYSHATFVDVYHAMLTPQGLPMDDLFIGDKLHMNEKGYKIWQQILLPYLDK